MVYFLLFFGTLRQGEVLTVTTRVDPLILVAARSPTSGARLCVQVFFTRFQR